MLTALFCPVYNIKIPYQADASYMSTRFCFSLENKAKLFGSEQLIAW